MINQSILHRKYFGHDLIDGIINSPDHIYQGMYYATVVSKPSKTIKGAVKVKVHGILDGDGSSDIKDELMPWATPAPSITFRVPKVGTQLIVYFNNNDIYFPVYIAQAGDLSGYNPQKESGDRSSYPDSSLIFSDQKNFRISYDSLKNEYVMSMPNDVIYTIDKDGKIHHTSPKGVDSGAEFPVLTEKTIDIWSARKFSGRGSGYLNVSHTQPNS